MKLNKTKVIILILCVIALGVVLYFIFRKKPQLPAEQLPPGAPGNAPAQPATDHFPLEEGSRGDNVKYLQRALNNINPSRGEVLKIDGVFGPATKIKLLSSVEAALAVLPMPQSNFNTIIKRGNVAVITPAAQQTQPTWYLIPGLF